MGKLDPNWEGPYKVIEEAHRAGYYKLAAASTGTLPIDYSYQVKGQIEKTNDLSNNMWKNQIHPVRHNLRENFRTNIT